MYCLSISKFKADGLITNFQRRPNMAYPSELVSLWRTLAPGETPWSKSSWKSLSSSYRAALEALGYTPASFAAVQLGDLRQLPPRAATAYEALESRDHSALTTLGYDARTWNKGVEARKDLFAHPRLLKLYCTLRFGEDGADGNAEPGVISADQAQQLIQESRNLFGLMHSDSGKRALAYLRDFAPTGAFEPAAHAALTESINESTWHSFSNLGWNATAEPDRTTYEKWRSDTMRGSDLVNDASGMSAALAYDLVDVVSEEHLLAELARARFFGLPLNVAGTRHSEGGHTCVGGCISANMMGMNRVEVLPNSDVRAEAGATWTQVIETLRRHSVARPWRRQRTVHIMQASNVFSVGGSVAVNCHGRTHNDGPLCTDIRSLRLCTAAGEVVECSRETHADLFRLAIGGYGAAGIVLSATLGTVPDSWVAMKSESMTLAEFPAKYAEMIQRGDLALGYGRIDPSFTAADGGDEINTVEASLNFAEILPDPPAKELPDRSATETLTKGATVDGREGKGDPPAAEAATGSGWLDFDMEQLGQRFNLTWLEQLVLAWSKRSRANLKSRWELEQVLRSGGSEGWLHEFLDLELGGLAQLPWHEGQQTDLLEELFIPFSPSAVGEAATRRDERLLEFLTQFRDLQRKHNRRSLNITVRYVKRDDETVLPYTPDGEEGCLAFVLYYNQQVQSADTAARAQQERDLFDCALSFGGRFYLPYQMHYTREQLLRAYPRFDEADAKRAELDPDRVLGSKLFATYGMRG